MAFLDGVVTTLSVGVMNSGEGAGEVGLLLGCHPAVVPPGFICALKSECLARVPVGGYLGFI